MHPESSVLAQLVEATWPYANWCNTRTLLAVSGGADSVAMLRVMLERSGSSDLIDVAHFNHGWRGDESDRDEAFVKELCEALGVRLFVTRAEETQEEPIARTEEAAREVRYKFLTSIAYQTGARYVVTAHTKNDRVETTLHNLFRGTGLAGVRSLGVTRPFDEQLVLARPLIGCTREQVEQYLEALPQDFQIDSSNSDQRYRRNFLRHSLIPTIREQYGPGLDDRILGFADIVADVDQMLAELATDYLHDVEIMAREANRQGTLERLERSMFAFPQAAVRSVPWPVLRQALGYVWLDRGWPLGKMTRSHWLAVRDLYLAESEVGDGNATQLRQVHDTLPGDLQLLTTAGWIVIGHYPKAHTAG